MLMACKQKVVSSACGSDEKVTDILEKSVFVEKSSYLHLYFHYNVIDVEQN